MMLRMSVVVMAVVGVVVSVPIQTDDVTMSDRTLGLSDMFPKFLFCRACKKVVQVAVNTIASNKTLDFFMTEVVDICRAEQYLQDLRGDIMCPGFVKMYGPVVLFVATNLILDPKRTCEELNFCASPHSSIPPIPPSYRRNNRPQDTPVKRREHNRRKQPRSHTERSKPLTIVQLADIHVDGRYAEGSPTDCNLVICCRRGFNGTGSAGKFGDYNCDVPWLTVEVILDHVTKLDPRPDFIIYSGDSPPHDIWEETWSSQLNYDYEVIKFLRSRLPDVSIYPTLGNHETFPQSQYYQPNEEYKALNKHTALWWHEHFHIPRDQIDNIQYSAYYTTLVRPGLRILSFNTNYWYTYNFYSLLNDKVPAHIKQMEFMEETLKNATIHDERVIMNAHIPPGNFPEVLLQYGDFYTHLAKTYADTIVMHTFGHNHRSAFEVMSDPDNSTNQIAVMLVAPSITSEGEVNPAYRVYKMDSDTYELLDYDQYYINLTKANEMGVATVEHAFSMTSEYNLPDLSPTSYYNFIQRMKNDESLYKRYRRNKYALSGHGPSCGQICKLLDICNMSTASKRAALKCLDSLH